MLAQKGHALPGNYLRQGKVTRATRRTATLGQRSSTVWLSVPKCPAPAPPVHWSAPRKTEAAPASPKQGLPGRALPALHPPAAVLCHSPWRPPPDRPGPDVRLRLLAFAPFFAGPYRSGCAASPPPPRKRNASDPSSVFPQCRQGGATP